MWQSNRQMQAVAWFALTLLGTYAALAHFWSVAS
jgi:hypothetical protein